MDCISSFQMAGLLLALTLIHKYFLQQLFEIGFADPHSSQTLRLQPLPIQLAARFVKSLLLDWRPESNFSSACLTIVHLFPLYSCLYETSTSFFHAKSKLVVTATL
ncbi:hypothetical protein PSHT_14252 [Puccinia striiformis]|uniref:Uncharacterized protein n=2 Tax=Puccinia striiformis TaxID=27350 RepID=A0A2S4VJZ7_9BASI|nr:hypothetical protein PSHT_14252 [Puccinia striiformis]POW09863.1 hypothetical protein PSTT_06473 [Puccinia striiformis]